MSSVYEFPSVVPIPVGHRLDVIVQGATGTANEWIVMAVVDLDSNIRYQRSEEAFAHTVVLRERVTQTTVTWAEDGARTVVYAEPWSVDDAALAEEAPVRGAAFEYVPGRQVSHGEESQEALSEADAAADASRRESERWGGIDKPPQPETPRFW